jgi:hypothetical protein
MDPLTTLIRHPGVVRVLKLYVVFMCPIFSHAANTPWISFRHDCFWDCSAPAWSCMLPKACTIDLEHSKNNFFPYFLCLSFRYMSHVMNAYEIVQHLHDLICCLKHAQLIPKRVRAFFHILYALGSDTWAVFYDSKHKRIDDQYYFFPWMATLCWLVKKMEHRHSFSMITDFFHMDFLMWCANQKWICQARNFLPNYFSEIPHYHCHFLLLSGCQRTPQYIWLEC